jgi:hypothetical protein
LSGEVVVALDRFAAEVAHLLAAGATCHFVATFLSNEKYYFEMVFALSIGMP